MAMTGPTWRVVAVLLGADVDLLHVPEEARGRSLLAQYHAEDTGEAAAA